MSRTHKFHLSSGYVVRSNDGDQSFRKVYSFLIAGRKSKMSPPMAVMGQ